MRINTIKQAVQLGVAAMALTLVVGCKTDSDKDTDVITTGQDAMSAYKMTTDFLGDQMALAATIVDGNTTFTFDTRDNLQGNQIWTIEPLSSDTYRIYNEAVGGNASLDVINDGVLDRLTLAPTADVSGQIWQITELENGYCRLTNQFLTNELALDVTSDGPAPTITMQSVDNVTGQFWQIEQVGAASGPIDGKCINSL